MLRDTATELKRWRKAFHVVLGLETTGRVAPTATEIHELLARMDELRCDALLASELRRGADLTTATATTVRAMLANGLTVPARMLAHRLATDDHTAQAGRIAGALI